MRADLHLHTTNSDGSDSPEAVFMLAKEAGVDMISITDHDTTYGIQENKGFAEKHGVIYVPGVEISAFDPARGRRCHIVGLKAHDNYAPLNELLQGITKNRHEIATRQLNMLIDLGYDISESDFKSRRGAHGFYKQHIMSVLIEKGYCTAMYGDFYNKMFKNNGPLHIEMDYPPATLAVKLLREAGCIPILAHPTNYDNLPYLDELIEAGLIGIEVSYPNASQKQRAMLLELAKDKALFASAGSDYHGAYRGSSEGRGVGECTIELPPEWI